MSRAHYALQALLYTVALHRYLRWRLPGYDPEQHLAGVLYLFLRGMAGAATPVLAGAPCGVFAWHPPGGARPALSDVLDEGAAAMSVTVPSLLDPFDARIAAGAHRAAARVQPRSGCSRRPTCTSPAGSRALAGEARCR